MKKRTIAAAAVLGVGLLMSQTRTHTSQIRGPVLSDARIIVLSSGRLIFATAGQGIQVVQTGSGAEIRAAATPATESVLSRAADGSWTLPTGCTLQAVYRNGLRQVRPSDYTVTGSSLRFTDGSSDPSLPDDAVVAECR